MDNLKKFHSHREYPIDLFTYFQGVHSFGKSFGHLNLKHNADITQHSPTQEQLSYITNLMKYSE